MTLCECGCGQTAPIAKATSKRDGYVKGKSIRFIRGHNARTPARRELSAKHMREVARAQVGARNPAWRGDDAQYHAKHKWAGENFHKRGVCEECGEPGKTEWSNVDHTYSRVREDWRELCVRCHRIADAHPFMTQRAA